jgi:hypothetical protein
MAEVDKKALFLLFLSTVVIIELGICGGGNDGLFTALLTQIDINFCLS